MDSYFDFGGRDKALQTAMETWDELRGKLAIGKLKYDEVEKAKEETFMHVFDDFFNNAGGKPALAKALFEVFCDNHAIGRGAKLKADEKLDYERLIPKKEYIRRDNRFSPPGVEWLYLTMGESREAAIECAMAECGITKESRFGFCQFEQTSGVDNCSVVDLTIVDHIPQDELNRNLERGLQKCSSKDGRNCIQQWAMQTYLKILSEKLFEPVAATDKDFMYAPFQLWAKYFESYGYKGIIYTSTVCTKGKNIVLFDKTLAKPFGSIDDKML